MILLVNPGGASGKVPACQCRRHRDLGSIPGLGRPPWRRKWQPTSVFLPGESHAQRSLAGCSPWGSQSRDTTEWLRSFTVTHTYQVILLNSHSDVEGKFYCLCAVDIKHLDNYHNVLSMEKDMATHSSILAWRIPCIEEPGRLQFMGSQELDKTWCYLYSL